jgi:hypothetical protein
LPALPDDVRKFAEENGILKYLPVLVELLERLIPGRAVTLHLDWDPEIPNDGYITFRADAEGLTADELQAAYDAWWNGVRSHCDRNDKHFFHFGM